MNIEEMRELLRNQVVEVVFIKKDGSERTMICTTHSDVLPNMSGSQMSKPLDGICTVWDIEADGWRSFKFDTLVSYKVISYVE